MGTPIATPSRRRRHDDDRGRERANWVFVSTGRDAGLRLDAERQRQRRRVDARVGAAIGPVSARSSSHSAGKR